MTARDKAAARKQARARRAAIAESTRIDAGAHGAAHFLASVPLSANAIVSAYWPLADEFDSLPLLQALIQAGHQVALPVVQGAGQPLCFRRWRPGDAMAVGSFGVSEPLAAAAEAFAGGRVVIVAGGEGDRRGYGLATTATVVSVAHEALEARCPQGQVGAA